MLFVLSAMFNSDLQATTALRVSISKVSGALFGFAGFCDERCSSGRWDSHQVVMHCIACLLYGRGHAEGPAHTPEALA